MAINEFGSLDSDFDDLDFEELGEEDTSGKRSPASRIKKVGDNLIDDLKTTDKDDIANIVGKAFKEVGGSQAGKITDGIDSFSSSMQETTNQLRSGLGPLMSALKRVGGDGFLGKMISKVDEKFGITNNRASSLRTTNKFDEEKTSASQEVASILGEQSTAENSRNLLLSAMTHNASNKQIQALNKLVGYQDRHFEFLTNTTSKYYRKSLETQYRMLFLSKRQLETNTKGFDLISKQLEGILKNTGLPEYVKLRGSEAVKSEIRRKITSNLLTSGVQNNDWINSLKDKAESSANNIKGMLLQASEAAGSAADASEMMESFTPEQLASMQLKDILLGTLGKKIGKGVKGLDKSGKIGNILNDPSAALASKASSTDNNFLSKFYGGLSRILAPSTRYESDHKIKSDDPNDISNLDNRMKTSVTRVIPEYLSKILAEVKGIRTGSMSSQLSFDYNGNRFFNRKDFDSEILTPRLGGGIDAVGAPTRGANLIESLSKNDEKGVIEKHRKEILESVLKRTADSKTLTYHSMKEDGFFKTFGDDAEEIAKLFDDAEIIEETQSFSRGLLRFRELVEDMIANGHVEPLIDANIIKYNKTIDEYEIDEKKLVDKNINILISKVLKQVNDTPNENFSYDENYKGRNKEVEDESLSTKLSRAKAIVNDKLTLDINKKKKLQKQKLKGQDIENMTFSSTRKTKLTEVLNEENKEKYKEKAKELGDKGLDLFIEKYNKIVEITEQGQKNLGNKGTILKKKLTKEEALSKLGELQKYLSEAKSNVTVPDMKTIEAAIKDLSKDIEKKPKKEITKESSDFITSLTTLFSTKSDKEKEESGKSIAKIIEDMFKKKEEDNKKRRDEDKETTISLISKYFNKPTSVFDKDGDGDRDGNWKDRLSMFKSTRQEKEEEKDPSKERDNTLLKTLGIFSGLMMLPIQFLSGLIGSKGTNMLGGFMSGIGGRSGKLVASGLKMTKLALGPIFSIFNPANIATGYRSIFKPLFSMLLGGLKELITKAFSRITSDVLPKILKHLSPKNMLHGIKQAIKHMGTKIESLAKHLKLDKVFSKLAEPFKGIYKRLGKLTGTIKKIYGKDGLKGLAKSFGKTLNEKFTALIKHSGEESAKLLKYVNGKTIAPLTKILTELSKKFIPENWINKFDEIGKATRSLSTTLADRVFTLGVKMETSMNKIVNRFAPEGLLTALKNVPGQIAVKLGDLLTGLVKAIVPESLQARATKIMAAAKKKAVGAYQYVTDKVSSGYKAAKEFVSETWTAAKGKAESAWKGIKNSKIGKFINKNYEKIAKKVRPLITKLFKKIFPLGLKGGKITAKVLSKIPVVALMVSGYFAYECIKAGEWEGAAVNMLSGLVASLPGGLIPSIMIDIYIVFNYDCGKPEEKDKELKEKMNNLTPEQRKQLEAEQLRQATGNSVKGESSTDKSDKKSMTQKEKLADVERRRKKALSKIEGKDTTSNLKRKLTNSAFDIEAKSIVIGDKIRGSSVVKTGKKKLDEYLNDKEVSQLASNPETDKLVAKAIKDKDVKTNAELAEEYKKKADLFIPTIKQLKKVAPSHPSLKKLEEEREKNLKLYRKYSSKEDVVKKPVTTVKNEDKRKVADKVKKKDNEVKKKVTTSIPDSKVNSVVKQIEVKKDELVKKTKSLVTKVQETIPTIVLQPAKTISTMVLQPAEDNKDNSLTSLSDDIDDSLKELELDGSKKGVDVDALMGTLGAGSKGEVKPEDVTTIKERAKLGKTEIIEMNKDINKPIKDEFSKPIKKQESEPLKVEKSDTVKESISKRRKIINDKALEYKKKADLFIPTIEQLKKVAPNHPSLKKIIEKRNFYLKKYEEYITEIRTIISPEVVVNKETIKKERVVNKPIKASKTNTSKKPKRIDTKSLFSKIETKEDTTSNESVKEENVTTPVKKPNIKGLFSNVETKEDNETESTSVNIPENKSVNSVIKSKPLKLKSKGVNEDVKKVVTPPKVEESKVTKGGKDIRAIVKKTLNNLKGLKFNIYKEDKMLLNQIAWSESPGKGYDDEFGSGKYTSHHKPISSMTIMEVYEIQKELGVKTKGTKHPTTAVGKYQFMWNTLHELVKLAGIPLSTVFSPAIQDKLILLRLYKKRRYGEWKLATINDKQFISNLSKEFASIENPYTGAGNYKNQRGAKNKASYFFALFKKMRAVMGQDPVLAQTKEDTKGVITTPKLADKVMKQNSNGVKQNDENIISTSGSSAMGTIKAAIGALIQFLTGMNPFGDEVSEDSHDLGVSDVDTDPGNPVNTDVIGGGDKPVKADEALPLTGDTKPISSTDISDLHFIDIRSSYNTKANDKGTQEPKGIIYHRTQGGSITSSLNWVYKQSGKGLGAHFWIGRDGKIYLAHDPSVFVWHAGNKGSKKKGTSRNNIGIEIAGRHLGGSKWEKLTDAQVKAIEKLTIYLHKKYGGLVHYFHGDKALWNKTAGEGYEAKIVADNAVAGKDFSKKESDTKVKSVGPGPRVKESGVSAPNTVDSPVTSGSKDNTTTSLDADGTNATQKMVKKAAAAKPIGHKSVEEGGIENKVGAGISDKDIQGLSVTDVFDIDKSKIVQWTGLDPEFKKRLLKMGLYWKKKYGSKLKFTSGYRSPEYQKKLYEASKKRHGGSTKMVAAPGHSMHNYGFAADIGALRNGKNTPMAILDAAGMLAKFGLYRPMKFEDWHIEPVETKGHRGTKAKDLVIGTETSESDLGSHTQGNIVDETTASTEVSGNTSTTSNMLSNVNLGGTQVSTADGQDPFNLIGNMIGGKTSGIISSLGKSIGSFEDIASKFKGDNKTDIKSLFDFDKLKPNDYTGAFSGLITEQGTGNEYLKGIKGGIDSMVEANNKILKTLEEKEKELVEMAKHTTSKPISKDFNIKEHIGSPMTSNDKVKVHS